MVRAQHNQPCDQVVRHVLAGIRQYMYARELACLAEIRSQALFDLVNDLVALALELLGAVLGKLGDGWLRGIPIAVAILVQIRRGAGQAPQRIAEYRRRFAWHDAAQLHTAVLQALVSSTAGG